MHFVLDKPQTPAGICSEMSCCIPGTKLLSLYMSVHLHTWQQRLVSNNIQWESRQTDFPIMDSCGDALPKAASTEPFCSSAAECSLIFMSAVSITTRYSHWTVKDEGLQHMLAYGETSKSVCLYSNVRLQAAPGYLRLLFWNLNCLE